LLRMVFSEERPRTPTPAIFLDRDGVINCRRPGDYVLNWAQFLFTPGIEVALSKLSILRLPMIIISNQACVGKGLLDPVAIQEITAQMHRSLLAGGIQIAAAYYCPHRTEDNCPCRKPKPALLYAAADDYNIDMNQSVFIGDSETDIQAGLEAGCKPILFGSIQSENSDYSAWGSCIPVARTVDELFEVAVKCLGYCVRPESSSDSV